jgi:ribonuclease Y
VERVYAMRAGREVRVIVDPGKVDDENAALISHQIAEAIAKEMEYPGQIKITVIRESRATSYAQ